MKSLQNWLSEYGESHQNPTNIFIHKIFFPLIMFSLIGLLWCIPMPEIFTFGGWFNWAWVLAFIALTFYGILSPKMFLGMLLIYKLNFFKMLLTSGYHGLIYISTFSITNITFVVSIQNTNVANTLLMIATAPMLSAILGAIFLKEPPDKKTWLSIIITFL